MADPPFGFHVHSIPGAGERAGCQEPRDDASVLDGGAERAIPLGVSGLAPVPAFAWLRKSGSERSGLLPSMQSRSRGVN